MSANSSTLVTMCKDEENTSVVSDEIDQIDPIDPAM